MAVSTDGSVFAITSGAFAVDVWAAPADSSKYALVGNVQPPASQLVPMALAFSGDAAEEDAHPYPDPFLAISWSDENGVDVVVTTYAVTGLAKGSRPKLDSVWKYSRKCPGSGSFDFVVPTALSVSSGGETVSVGSWGCLNGAVKGPVRHPNGRFGGSSLEAMASAVSGGDKNEAAPNVVILKGRGGDGKPLMEDTLPGKVWAVATSMGLSSPVVSVGSWFTRDGSTPSQVTTYAVKHSLPHN